MQSGSDLYVESVHLLVDHHVAFELLLDVLAGSCLLPGSEQLVLAEALQPLLQPLDVLQLDAVLAQLGLHSARINVLLDLLGLHDLAQQRIALRQLVVVQSNQLLDVADLQVGLETLGILMRLLSLIAMFGIELENVPPGRVVNKGVEVLEDSGSWGLLDQQIILGVGVE